MDFERAVTDASEYKGFRRASQFSWSIARETLFRRCRKAYFIRYYLSQGGWNVHAHPLVRSAWLEKYHIPFRIWLERSFQGALRRAFRKTSAMPVEARKKAFNLECLRSLGNAVTDLQFSLENREYEDDPKKPAILEFIQSKEPETMLNVLKQNAVSSFSSAYSVFVKSRLFPAILALDFTDLRLDEPLISFQFEQWSVWFAPDIVWFDRGQFRLLLCRACEPGDEDASANITAGVFELYVKSKWYNRECSSAAFAFSAQCAAFYPLDPAADIRSFIRDSSLEMLSLIRPDATVHAADFPRTADPAQCAHCPFANTCKELPD